MKHATDISTTLGPITNTTTSKPTNITTLIPNPADMSLSVSTVILLCSLTAVLLLVACLVVFVHYFRAGKGRNLDARTRAVILFLAALVATIAGVSGTTSALHVYRIYIFIIGLCVGLTYTIFGAYMFFDNKPVNFHSDGQKMVRPIGHHHGNMGIVIWLVTLPLVAMEFAILLGNLRTQQTTFYIADYIVALLQKLTQAAVYYFSVRHRYPSSRLPFASQWYFAVLSLYNFIMWDDSILTSHMDDGYSRQLYGNGFTIFKATYNSLLIDYRLMCCLLFVEHAVEISKSHVTRTSPRQPGTSPHDSSSGVETKEKFPQTGQVVQLLHPQSTLAVHYTGMGYLVGLLCFALQAVNGLQYLGFVGPWSSCMAMVAHVLMFILGTIFLKLNCLDKDFDRWKESNSKAIDVMVGIMGGVGVTFMIVRALLTSHMATFYSETSLTSYLSMTAGKNCFNAIGLLFQFYMFMKVPFNACSQRKNESIVLNHFLVPSLTMVQFAIFVTAVVDQYDGIVERLLSQANLGPAILFFLGIGAPLYLGFCLHMFLHFLIVRRDMTTKKARVAFVMEDPSSGNPRGCTPSIPVESTEEIIIKTQSELLTPLL